MHLFMVKSLFNNNPHVEKIYETLVNILIKTNNWQQLLIISEKAQSKKIIEKETSNINKSIAYYEIAKIKQDSDIQNSIQYVKKALKLRHYFPPIYKIIFRIINSK